ncbi:hypothetical protein BDV29DRAFT_156819 [Aspergillus leporis]|uniref:Uncharacterized protein n=1 Tax=Aspergillus leporis TaxID=41062 RepID=A0A5N5X400_9EURO|nr:hypothetical protein BDV29DRAFT_156819 [Aspergillus leporis]
MSIDVLTTVTNNGTLNFTRVYRTKRDRPAIPVEEILDRTSKYRFIFQNPIDLHKLFEDPDPASAAICSGMRKLRLDLLHPLSNLELTEGESTGGLSDGPNVTPVVENWEYACRAIPKNHGIEDLIFDISCKHEIISLSSPLRRLVQYASASMGFKAKGNLRCQVQRGKTLKHKGPIEALERCIVAS